MANARRGEIEAVLDGKTHRLVLTLGALAELEHAFGDSDLLALASRFEAGRLSSSDCLKIIGAGLRGAGHAVGDDDVARMQADGGAKGFIEIVVALLNATFGGSGNASGGAEDRDARGAGSGVEARRPFPGTT